MSTAAPFVTATMARIYLRQGHLDRAERVYQQLLAERPADEGLERGLVEVQRARLATRPATTEVAASAAAPLGQAGLAASAEPEVDPERSGIGALLRQRPR